MEFYEDIFSELELKIDKLLTKDELSQNFEYSPHECADDSIYGDEDLFVSRKKLLILFFGKPEMATPVKDINAPVFDGLFPLHLALLASSFDLFDYLIDKCGAKLDVKCFDAASPFHGMSPFEMVLDILRQLIPWTPELSCVEFVSKFRGRKATLLLGHLSSLVYKSSGIRDLIMKHTLQGNLTDLVALLMVVSVFDTNLSSMHLPTASIPPEYNQQVPIMLRLFVAARISSLIAKQIELSGYPVANTRKEDEESEKCSTDLTKMTTIMKLLLSADRGELVAGFSPYYIEKLEFSIEDAHDFPKGSQDESWASRYLDPNSFYKMPSEIQPCGIFYTLAPPGNTEIFRTYDGLYSGNGRAITEAFFRELNGKKIEELSLSDTIQFRDSLGCVIQQKIIEADTLKRFSEKLSLPNDPASKSTFTFTTFRMMSTAAALTTRAPCYRSGTTGASGQVVARKLLSVLYAIKRV
ncbi:hypothetical protein POM88_009999 [Heracleum sosnowskyi]|uniref:Uncharacterized protein n=1 Tax=Heracleum sosnowskyi TaxID=360622 RepID=A0AAD8JCJ6_9APIA|nr:hypothetical protein POM88_009999 [Heracleum sosnowskyi]